MHRFKDFLASRAAPDQFTTFCILYAVPVIHELGDPWWTWGGRNPPILLQGLIMALATIVALRISPAMFLLFLAISAFYYLLAAFPEIPNHMTLLVYCNLVMLIGLPIIMHRRRPIADNDAIFSSLKPVLRLILITLFFIAGFHKLNWDFLNPEVSCVNFVVGLLEGRVFRSIFGVPFVVYLSPLLIALVYWALRRFQQSNIDVVAATWSVVAFLVPVLVAGVLLSTGDFHSIIIATGAALTLAWQLIEGPLLFARRLQGPILLLSLILLGTIAISGVPMFPAVLLPLIFVFVPDHVFVRWRDNSLLTFGDIRVHAIYIYLLINLLGASLVYITATTSPSYQTSIIVLAISQSLFLFGVALLLIPLFRELLSSNREWTWGGVKVWDGTAPRGFLIFPLLLLIWGMTPYLGLRTTGNFSMFSNVKTEGPVSNHLVLSNNPLKFWNYQEDRVKIIEVDEDTAKAGHHYDPLNGNSLPEVEFRKLVTIWRDAGRVVPMTYQYRSSPVRTEDITQDENWISAERTWETYLLDFRPVQESGPNLCRW
jgi:hypothetical protein